MRAGVIPELGDQRMLLERGLNNGPLHAAAAAVHEAELRQARLVRGADVFLDHRRNVARRERVEIQLRLDGDVVNHVGAGVTRRRSYGCFRYSAMTLVVMPPRTENDPVTVILRG